MSSAAIMDAVLTKIKTVLSESKEVLACDVSPEQAEEVSRLCELTDVKLIKIDD